MSQMNLSHVKARTGHANLGKEFEAMLDRAHDQYARLLLASIYKIPNAFEFCGWAEHGKLAKGLKAVTDLNAPLKRAKTPFDYVGCVFKVNQRAVAVAFDAKQFSGTNIPLTEFKPQQVEWLTAWQRLGALAGFMVYAADAGDVFWVWASLVRSAQDKVIFQKGRGKHPKSLSVEWLKANAVAVGTFRSGQAVDWLEAVTRS